MRVEGEHSKQSGQFVPNFRIEREHFKEQKAHQAQFHGCLEKHISKILPQIKLMNWFVARMRFEKQLGNLSLQIWIRKTEQIPQLEQGFRNCLVC